MEIEQFRKDHQTAVLSSLQIKGVNFAWFEPDYAYRTTATFHATRKEKVTVASSNSQILELAQWGFVQLRMNFTDFALFLYAKWDDENPTVLSAPFRDLTNGRSTYRGGRNLLVPVKDGVAHVDFNHATNLMCAYGPQFHCALPPEKNTFACEISAGERLPQKII